MRRDIDDALRDWPHDPEPGEILAREVRARDGRMVLQVRVELGLLQMEVDGRPDGTRPHHFTTVLDYLRHRAAARGLTPGKPNPTWTMSTEDCLEADREFIQFYHRRTAWLSLQRYDRALIDADHTLALMDFVARHGATAAYRLSHEKFRGLVLFQRTQACTALALERRKPEDAVDAISAGIRNLEAHQKTLAEEPEIEDELNESLIQKLHALEFEIRQNFPVAKTLREQLEEAIASEDYEKAARLRDQIRSNGP